MKLWHQRGLALVILILLLSTWMFAQDVMRVTRKDNSIVDIPVSDIESINFIKGSPTVASDVLKDGDGNVYRTVKIGNQIWMAENLRSTKYIDGSPIPEVKDAKAWADNTTGAFCWYNNDGATYDALYGKLYNWHAINTGKLAPPGWRVPTDEDWDELVKTLGGDKLAGMKMKIAGKLHWQGNEKATNESGFGAYSGFRSNNGGFIYHSTKGLYWSSTQNFNSPQNAFGRELAYSFDGVNRVSYHKGHGGFVRFIKE